MELEFTGERIIPGKVDINLFREHEERYQLAGRFVRGRVVVDVACGVGVGTDYLRRAGAERAIGIDIDRESLTYARRRYPKCWFVQADAERIPLNEEVADVVVSFETIEHLQKPWEFLLECGRILKKGGLLICSTPNRKVYRLFGENSFHVHEFEVEEFMELISKMFVVVEVYGQNTMPYPGLWLRRRIIGALDALGMGSWLRKVRDSLLRKGRNTNCPMEFSVPGENDESRLRTWSSLRWYERPCYVVVVGCRK
jgi:SAM-dependent methyltransferase